MNLISAQIHRIRNSLHNAGPVAFSAYAIFAAFFAYFCMYAFRRPYTVGAFEGQVSLPFVGDLEFKILLILSQVFGYMISKFMGIKFVSETSGNKRGRRIIFLILIAELALFMFAITPAPYNAIWLFINGMPLGMVWGLVFGFLEGRRVSEALGAGLSASYIVASGATRSSGQIVLNMGVAEHWMPFVTGLFFLPFLILFVGLLKLIPPPTREDELERTRRAPMNSSNRWEFFTAYAPGLILLTLLYMFLTAYRDFRDNFAREIWAEMGFEGQPEVFAVSELFVAGGVLVGLAMLMFIRRNKTAFIAIHIVMLSGTALVGFSTLAFEQGYLSPMAYMILIGLGLYLAYVPYGCMLFDRLIAAVHFIGTAGFLIYLTDAFGYLGSVGLLLYRNFATPDLAWLDFFLILSYTVSILCSLCFLGSLIYFYRHTEYRKSK